MLSVARNQILAFRRATNALDRRLPKGKRSLRTAAWAGMQDSMPRAALLSIHARVEDAHPLSWDDPSLVQVWGPRYQVYVVAEPDLPLFTLARLPETGTLRARAIDYAARLELALAGERLRDRDVLRAMNARLRDRDVFRAMKVGNSVRYATLTGRVAIRWEGARAPVVWIVPPPKISAETALLELGRRHLHVFGPTNAAAFAKWAGIGAAAAAATFENLAKELVPVRTPVGDAWLLASDEATLREPPTATAPARFLPSGDAFWLHGTPDERALLVPNAKQRGELWTPRVWPGALLVGGEFVGTWRRAKRSFTIELWRKLTAAERDAVVAEAESLPLPDPGPTVVSWS
jgi:hypothetical protein